MSTTVAVGGFEITSNHESGDSMVESLTPPAKKEGAQVIRDKGKDADEPKDDLSKAASELGKKGGQAAARARQERDTPKVTKDAGVAVEEKAKAAAAKVGTVDDEDLAEAKALLEEKEAESDPVKRKERAAERVAEATRKARQERLRADALEAEVQRLRSAPPQPTAPQRQDAPPEPQEPRQATTAADDDPEPQEGDYPEYKDYVKDVSRWAARQERRVAAQHEARERFAHEYAAQEVQKIDTFRSKVAEVIKADPSRAETVIPFRDVLQNSSHGIPPGQRPTAFNVLNDEILRSENPVPLMEHLKGNPDVVRSILDLTTREAIARKMERIQASLEGATAGTPPPRRAVSQAPPPVRPVTGSPHTAEPDESEMTFDQLAKRRGLKRPS